MERTGERGKAETDGEGCRQVTCYTRERSKRLEQASNRGNGQGQGIPRLSVFVRERLGGCERLKRRCAIMRRPRVVLASRGCLG